ncbi:MAG: sigma-54-dependent Fis family transcriptional regulator [Calditrichaeota bacterium]|nr:MAG: sigma-54-dependent Fis family transcriptional regulator [Calditrichota bacterium]
MMNNSKKILIVEDNETWSELFTQWIGDHYDIEVATNKEEALQSCQSFEPDLIILDLGLPQTRDGLELLDDLMSRGQDYQIIVVTSYQEHEYALEAQRRGAYSYFSKGDDNLADELPFLIRQALKMQQLERENKELRSKLQQNIRFDDIVAISKQMQEILATVERIKNSSEPVLILGESGVGKEVIARHIFKQSTRFKDNFVAINCSALPPNLLESELFGYEQGAFTGAMKTTRGKFELANNGTLFLDEIGDMPLELQAKLLRVLETKRFFRLGGEKEVEVNFRLISATNQPLAELIKKNKFREDLYYRINVMPIVIPPLRERPDDIPAMIDYFAEKFCRENDYPRPKFTTRVIACLSHLPWEGNARELENTVKRLILTNQRVIDIEHLPPDILEETNSFLDIALANELTLEEVTKLYVKMVLDLKKGNKKEACKLLNINYRTLMKKLS